MSTVFQQSALEREVNRLAPSYTSIELDALPDRKAIRALVSHAGETRDVTVSYWGTSRDEMIVACARQALELARYLDDLRQGMRDLVDP